MIEICPKKQCTGCAVCANICPKQCITFKQDQEGFFFPEIDTTVCVECKLCQKICPANSEPEYHPAQERVYAAWALDDNIRQSSSSGGLYSVFANYIFSQDGVVNGVVFDKDMFAVHNLFYSPESILPCRGSKYVQSHPGNIYKRIKEQLEIGNKVLFTSTPCQVNALYKFLGKDYDNLFTCDIICHGVPSPQYFKDCLKRITDGAENIEKVTFRNLSGWGQYKIKAECRQSFYDEENIHSVYTKNFLGSANCRYSCYQCSFTRNERVADITLGDFWGLGKFMPFFHDTRKGVSLLIVNTPKGEALLNKVKDQLFLENRSFREAARENHQLYRSVAMSPNRADFYTDAKKLSSMELIRKYEIKIPLLKKILSLPVRIYGKAVRVSVKLLVILFLSHKSGKRIYE